jgi:choline kinase
VTGHAAEAVERFLAERPHLGATTLFNPDFARLNNWWSVLLALRALPGPDARLVLLNGDLLVEPTALARFLADAATTEAEGLLAVDLARDVTDESMKVELDAGEALEAIGKVGISRPAGEYVGLLMARGDVLARLRAALEAFVGRPEAVDEWYEGAIGRTVREGARWGVWPMPDGRWVEIDDDDDLAVAVELVGA